MKQGQFANVPRYDFELYRGVDTHKLIRIVLGEGDEKRVVNYDIGELIAEVKRHPLDGKPLASFSCTYDNEQQAIRLHMGYEESKKIVPARRQEQGQFYYDVIHVANGSRTAVVFGEVTVRVEVSNGRV